jgi:hypothetical protein
MKEMRKGRKWTHHSVHALEREAPLRAPVDETDVVRPEHLHILEHNREEVAADGGRKAECIPAYVDVREANRVAGGEVHF